MTYGEFREEHHEQWVSVKKHLDENNIADLYRDKKLINYFSFLEEHLSKADSQFDNWVFYEIASVCEHERLSQVFWDWIVKEFVKADLDRRDIIRVAILEDLIELPIDSRCLKRLHDCLKSDATAPVCLAAYERHPIRLYEDLASALQYPYIQGYHPPIDDNE